jgi:CRP-like cAMP-binding protein
MVFTGGNLIPSIELKEELLRLASMVSKPRGGVLFRRGDAVSGLFLILSGKVSLGLEDENPIFPARILSAGCIAGLPATVSGNPYSLTARVVKDADLAFVPRDAVLHLLHSNVNLCFQVMDMLSGEISQVRSTFKATDAHRRSGT